MKACKNSRWRAYARGTLDLCERQTDFAVNARSAITVAPKDVERLECLRKPTDLSMSERYDAAVEKENKEWTSLIAATTATVTKKRKSSAVEEEKEDEEADTGEDEEVETKEQPKKKAKNKKQKKPTPKGPPKPPPKADDSLLEMKDTVAEGIDWSDDGE